MSVIHASPKGMSGQRYAAKLYVMCQVKLTGQKVSLGRLRNQLYMSTTQQSLQDIPNFQHFSVCMQSNIVSTLSETIVPNCLSISSHVNFLREVISVSGERYRRCHQTKSLTLTVESVVNTLLETLTDSMAASLSSPLHLHIAELITKAVKSFNAESVGLPQIGLPQTIACTLKSSVRKLFTQIVSSTSIMNMNNNHCSALKVVRKLCEDDSIRHCILAVVGDLIGDCFSKLQIFVNIDDDVMEACEIENVAYLFTIMESLIICESGDRSRDYCSLDEHIESCIHIGSAFPLLSHYFWHISKLIRPTWSTVS